MKRRQGDNDPGDPPSLGTGSMAGDLIEHWSRIVARYEANTPPGTLVLPAGASEEGIDIAEAVIEVSFPDDLRAFYRLHDGLGPSYFIHYGEFLSLNFLVSIHATMPFGEEAASIPRPERITGPIKPVWFSRRRIPITDLSGDGVQVDLDPALGGTVGQIIKFEHEDGPTRVLAPSFSRWLARIAWALEAGRLVWRPEQGQVAPPGYGEPGTAGKDWESDWAEPS